ncbi:hypothetical protein ACWEJ6_45705 [Nonomuraea sp. NPDC004702]
MRTERADVGRVGGCRCGQHAYAQLGGLLVHKGAHAAGRADDQRAVAWLRGGGGQDTVRGHRRHGQRGGIDRGQRARPVDELGPSPTSAYSAIIPEATPA